MKIHLTELTSQLVGLSALLLCSCASLNDPQYYNDEKRLEEAVYVNGRSAIQDSNYAFLTTRDSGIVLVEFDSKPYFIQNRRDKKQASPLRLPGTRGDLIISPGAHSLTLKYELVEPAGLLGASLGIDRVAETIKTESKLEFIAEKGHTYVIKGNVTTDRKTREKIWNPEIQDLPPKQHNQ